MSPRIKWIGVVVVVGVGLMLCIFLASPRKPLHKGKSVDYWVDRACGRDDAVGTREARQEVRYIGPAAVPLLIEKLRSSDGLGRSAPYLWLNYHTPIRLQRLVPDVRPAEEEQHGAIGTLAEIGPVAKPAVADLVRLMPKFTDPVIGVLEKIGPGAKEALPALHTLLTNKDIVVHDTNHYLRVQIAWALWSINRETNTVLDVCTNAMVPGVHGNNAAFLVSKLSTAAAPAVPFALQILRDTNSDGRGNAANVLGVARVSSPEILAALLDGTRAGDDPSLRDICEMSLWRLDNRFAPLATRLFLEDIVSGRKVPGKSTEDFTIWLRARDLDAREAIPTLRQLLESDSPAMRTAAADVLHRIEAENQIRTKSDKAMR